MERAFVAQIIYNNKIDKNISEEAIIVTESKNTYTIPLCILPLDIIENDFIILDHGSIIIDPNNDQMKSEIYNQMIHDI